MQSYTGIRENKSSLKLSDLSKSIILIVDETSKKTLLKTESLIIIVKPFSFFLFPYKILAKLYIKHTNFSTFFYNFINKILHLFYNFVICLFFVEIQVFYLYNLKCIFI